MRGRGFCLLLAKPSPSLPHSLPLSLYVPLSLSPLQRTAKERTVPLYSAPSARAPHHNIQHLRRRCPLKHPRISRLFPQHRCRFHLNMRCLMLGDAAEDHKLDLPAFRDSIISMASWLDSGL